MQRTKSSVPSKKIITKNLSTYVTRKMTLKSFRDWFIPESWDVEEWADLDLQKLVYDIKLRLAEYTSGHWSEDDLREKLNSLMPINHRG